jgi:hypothetical protein
MRRNWLQYEPQRKLSFQLNQRSQKHSGRAKYAIDASIKRAIKTASIKRAIKTMKIAQVSPLAEAVPPKLYGGTECIVAYLTDALIELVTR